MPTPAHITVTAPPGKRTPVHHLDGVEPGGAQLHVTPGVIRRVRYSQAVRRSVARGDLIMCDMNGAAVDSAELAAASDELPGGYITIGRGKGVQ